MRRPEEWSTWTNGLQLLSMVASVHRACAGWIIVDDTIGRYVTAIRWAVENWQEGSANFERYDNAIKEVCIAALAEWDSIVQDNPPKAEAEK